MKDFAQSLRDGFTHITEITDKDTLEKLRGEGILIDTEGYYSFSFGEHKEFELCIEPYLQDGQYFVSIYKNRVLLNGKLPIWIHATNENR